MGAAVIMQEIIPYASDGGIAKLSCNGVSLTKDGEWLLPFWREIGGGAPCQSVPKSAKALHGVAGVLISSDQVICNSICTGERMPRQTAINLLCNYTAQSICMRALP